jgi:YjbE family integral membrane protein
MLEMMGTFQFWGDVSKIMLIDLLLSGDNAVVIALACRNLPVGLRKKGILLGVIGAIVLRVLMTIFAVMLLSLPYLKLAGALLLVWIGVRLIVPGGGRSSHNAPPGTRLLDAVQTIVVADFVMSLDNVVGVAGAAHGNVALLIFGLIFSLPLVAWSSQLMLKLIDRYSFTIYAGGGLLGYVAGEMMAEEGFVGTLIDARPYLRYVIPILCALLVMCTGKWLATRMVINDDVIDVVDKEVIAATHEDP